MLVSLVLFACMTTKPVELGQVSWERDFAAAEKRAKAENKDLFVLFQEVPG